MTEQLVQAIKNKYGVSDEVSQQVVDVLAAAEKKRQDRALGSNMRAAAHSPSATNTNDMRGALTDVIGSLMGGQGGQGSNDLMGMVGGLLGGAQASQGQQGVQNSGDLLGMVGHLLGGQQPQGGGANDMIGIIGNLIGGQSGGTPQGGHNVISILSDLMNNSTHGSGQPDLGSMLNGLLGGQQGGQGSPDISGLVGSLLGGGQPSAPTQHPAPTQHTNPAKPNMGSLQDKLDQGMLAKPSNPKKSLKDNSLGNEKKKF